MVMRRKEGAFAVAQAAIFLVVLLLVSLPLEFQAKPNGLSTSSGSTSSQAPPSSSTSSNQVGTSSSQIASQTIPGTSTTTSESSGYVNGTVSTTELTADACAPTETRVSATSYSPSTNTRPVVTDTNIPASLSLPLFDPMNGCLYVPQDGGDALLVVSTVKNELVGAVTVGSWPQTPVLDTFDGYLYVPNGDGDTVSVVSGTTNGVVANLLVGTNPLTPAFDSYNGEIYVPNADNGSVSVISGTTNSVIATIPVGHDPGEAVSDPSNGDVYVPLTNDSLVILSGNSNTVIASVSLPGSPIGPPLFDSATGNIYVTTSGSKQNVESVVSGASNAIIANVTVGTDPSFPMLDPTNGNIYVPNYGNPDFYPGTVSVISTTNNSLVATITVGFGPTTPALDSLDGRVYIADSALGGLSGPLGALPKSISVISETANAVIANVTVSCSAEPAVFDSANGDVYSPCGPYEPLSVVASATESVVATVRMLPQGIGIAAADNDPNHLIYGYAVSLSISGATVATGYTSVTFSDLTYGQEYAVSVQQNEGNCTFMAWENGNRQVVAYGTNATLTVYAGSDYEGLTALYDCG